LQHSGHILIFAADNRSPGQGIRWERMPRAIF
jgi:hypothetical protein